MPTINIPGVPALLNAVPGFNQVTTFLRGDLVPSVGGKKPQWGVYKGGKPVVVFETFVSIDYKQGWAISDFPLEPGAFESYDKVELPFDARVRFAAGGEEGNRIALLQSIKAAAPTLDLYTIVTPEVVYPSVNIQHYNYRRTAANGVGLLQVEVWFLEIRVTTKQAGTREGQVAPGTPASTAAFNGTNAATPIQYSSLPGGMSAYNAGFVQSGLPRVSEGIPSPFASAGVLK